MSLEFCLDKYGALPPEFVAQPLLMHFQPKAGNEKAETLALGKGNTLRVLQYA
ncbi:hypothetical protein [Nostoc sp. UHCC 0251]|uniref:hypothetical protein n=1 Tax=Nostoc sp. UHCC 0251 TaxID=3110240 RepID=UPI002B20475B|nr:hypothetical protein [Nostoc sp. UHCC 0251]MEA5621966.1 hypothetical protein [Nostoc sp. UHCC 0251]